MDSAQRQLVILRHAKSAWPDGVPERLRPLAGRGRRDAPAVGAWLREHVGRIDAVLCSPAERARRTWELVAAELADPPVANLVDHLYGATAPELLAAVRELPDSAATALLIGHNPDLEDLVTLLTGQDVVLKTSSVAVTAWPGRWSDAAAGTAELRHHETPRG